jgi:hypothetical protein
VIVGIVKDEVLWTINSLEILGIIYLAIAVSKLRERIARMEGRGERQNNVPH